MRAVNDLLQEIRNHFSYIIRTEFTGGITPSSIIDRKKFGRLFSEYFPFPFPADYEDEASITNLCNEACIPLGKKFYAVAPETRTKLDEILSELRASSNTIYFDCLYKKYSEILREFGINSPQILAGCINKFFSFNGDENYFCFRPLYTISMEALPFFPEKTVIGPENMAESLPFIPVEKTREA